MLQLHIVKTPTALSFQTNSAQSSLDLLRTAVKTMPTLKNIAEYLDLAASFVDETTSELFLQLKEFLQSFVLKNPVATEIQRLAESSWMVSDCLEYALKLEEQAITRDFENWMCPAKRCA